MRASKQRILSLLGTLFLSGAILAPGTATAEDVAQDDEDEDEPQPSIIADEVRWGVGMRVRRIHLPESVLELFVADAPGGGSHTGYGLEVVRQRGNFTLALGVEMEDLAAGQGIWVDKGDTIPQDPVDYVKFDDFGWIGVDLSFLWQAGLVSDVLFLRYGAGLGLGVLRGEILQTDYTCANDNIDSCVQDPNAMNIDAPADLPPVFPIINMIVGAQIRPIPSIAINLEGGIRTVPFFGGTLVFMY